MLDKGGMKMGDDGEVEEGRCWADMLPEALAHIFSFLPLQALLHTVPCVCWAWHHASLDAACWRRVDLSHWCQGKNSQIYERMLSLVVNRSQDGLREIVAPCLIKDTMLKVVARSGASIGVLRIPNSVISENCMCQLAPKFASLTYLDIEGRYFSSKALLECYAKHCPLITRLGLDTSGHRGGVDAVAIAQYMPWLKHLQLCGCVSNDGLRTLLEKCTSLEYVDLRGCWHFNVEESTIVEARKRLKVFFTPEGALEPACSVG